MLPVVDWSVAVIQQQLGSLLEFRIQQEAPRASASSLCETKGVTKLLDAVHPA